MISSMFWLTLGEVRILVAFCVYLFLCQFLLFILFLVMHVTFFFFFFDQIVGLLVYILKSVVHYV